MPDDRQAVIDVQNAIKTGDVKRSL